MAKKKDPYAPYVPLALKKPDVVAADGNELQAAIFYTYRRYIKKTHNVYSDQDAYTTEQYEGMMRAMAATALENLELIRHGIIEWCTKHRQCQASMLWYKAQSSAAIQSVLIENIDTLSRAIAAQVHKGERDAYRTLHNRLDVLPPSTDMNYRHRVTIPARLYPTWRVEE